MKMASSNNGSDAVEAALFAASEAYRSAPFKFIVEAETFYVHSYFIIE